MEDQWVSYEKAMQFTGKGRRTLERAVANGELKTIGNFKPVRLSPRSVVEYAYICGKPSSPKARELIILWRLLLTEPQYLPKHWPSANAPDRWKILDRQLAHVGSAPEALSTLFIDYAASEIAFVAAFHAAAMKKKFTGGGNLPVEFCTWSVQVAEKNNTTLQKVWEYITPLPYLCSDCGKVGRHVFQDNKSVDTDQFPSLGSVADDSEFQEASRKGEYPLHCKNCGREWVEKLTYEDYKGRCAAIFDSFNSSLPPSQRIEKRLFWVHVREALINYKRRSGGYTMIRYSDIAGCFVRKTRLQKRLRKKQKRSSKPIIGYGISRARCPPPALPVRLNGFDCSLSPISANDFMSFPPSIARPWKKRPIMFHKKIIPPQKMCNFCVTFV